jgi:biopolymer transport protein ExbB
VGGTHRIPGLDIGGFRPPYESRLTSILKRATTMAARPRRLRLISASLVAAALVSLPGSSRAREQVRSAAPAADEAATAERPAASAPSAQRPGIDRSSVVRLLLQANPMLWPLVACSIVALAYALERGLALRRDRVIPREFADRFLERLSAGKLDRERALELCRAHDSPAARVFAIVVGAWGQPGATIRQVVAHDAAGEVVELKRNLRILSAMATLGPLLGLLGTVVGIIQSFDALGGRVGPSRSEALAHGISLALVATAIGLAIAIVSVVFYYLLLNRVDILVRELDQRTRQVIELVSAEAQRLGPTDRRHLPLPSTEPQRQESRVL